MRLSPAELFARALLGLLALSSVALIAIYWQVYGYSGMFGDFYVFFHAAQHVGAGELGKIYDVEHIRQTLESGKAHNVAYFLNPPYALLLVYPLRFFGPGTGLILWTTLPLLLLLALARTHYLRELCKGFSSRAMPTSLLLILALLTFSLQNIFFGQVACLCTALFLLVVSLRKTQAVIAGIILGIFSFKPQLGLLLPLLLLAEKNWTALFTALATTLLLGALSYFLWGPALWVDYGNILALRSHFLAQSAELQFMLSISVYAGARNLGASAQGALGFQIVAAIAAIAFVWPVLRKTEERKKILCLCLASFLTTPYVLIYDMALLALPCALLLRKTEANQAATGELIALLALILMPLVALLLQIGHIPYCVLAVAFTLVVVKAGRDSELQQITDK